MYEEVDESIEKWSKIVYFVSVVLSPTSLILPNIILSFYIYFTTDSAKNDAFILLLSMWYVHWFGAFNVIYYFLIDLIYYFLKGFHSIGKIQPDIYWLQLSNI